MDADQLLPTQSSERIQSLDVLRGFAVLGILVMNIQMFSMVAAAYFNPTAYGNLEGINFWVWFLSHTFADLKFMGIFSMLFGAGVVLMWQRAERSGRSALGLHYRRMFWLMVFGLLHAHLLWFGDILFPYAICGMIIYWFRRLRPLNLMIVGFAALFLGSSLSLLSGLSMPYWPPEEKEKFTEESWSPPPEKIEIELVSYRGGWLEQMETRVESALELETFVLLYFFLWRAGGLMLIGMALFKLGVLSAAKSSGFYWILVLLGGLLGLPVVIYGALHNIESGWPPSTFFVGVQFNYWGSILVSLGWIGLVVLFCREGWLRSITVRLAALGRMALSGYLLETLICTTVFYGHGLGLFGRLERIQQVGVLFGVWIVLLLFAPWWMERFRYGLFEWVWRSLTYWKVLPLRR
jgi:uncharacterized protein